MNGAFLEDNVPDVFRRNFFEQMIGSSLLRNYEKPPDGPDGTSINACCGFAPFTKYFLADSLRCACHPSAWFLLIGACRFVCVTFALLLTFSHRCRLLLACVAASFLVQVAPELMLSLLSIV